jgi:hypothetical protein
LKRDITEQMAGRLCAGITGAEVGALGHIRLSLMFIYGKHNSITTTVTLSKLAAVVIYVTCSREALVWIWAEMSKEADAAWLNLRVHSGICIHRLSNSTMNLHQNGRYRSRDSNRAPSKYVTNVTAIPSVFGADIFVFCPDDACSNSDNIHCVAAYLYNA